LITTVIESLAEAFALMRKSGVDPHKFLEVLTDSLFSAPVYKNYGAMIASEKFEPVGFKMPLGFKDNRLVLAAAEEASVPMPMASLVHDRFVAAMAQGLENADWSAIARVAYKNGGLKKGNSILLILEGSYEQHHRTKIRNPNHGRIRAGRNDVTASGA
jgi:3-hydroxyisobutyrate dehydrogenase-like beta-hydroxyacid dehydrogenase